MNMSHHITLPVSDLGKSKRLYDAVLSAPDHDAVDLFHKLALELGASCDG